jgi:hypothetical protein
VAAFWDEGTQGTFSDVSTASQNEVSHQKFLLASVQFPRRISEVS